MDGVTTPTREELQAAAHEAREATWREMGSFFSAVVARGSLKGVDASAALDAYGAACQALGEHIGRERMLGVAQDLQRGQGISLQEALWLLGGQMPTEQEGGRDAPTEEPAP